MNKPILPLHIVVDSEKDQSSAATRIDNYWLGEKEHLALKSALANYHYSDHENYEAQIREAQGILITACPNLVDAIGKWKNRAVPTGPMVINNLPVDTNVMHGPKTPETASQNKATSISEGALLGIVARLGEPYGVWQEGHGLINNLSPTRAARNELTGLGSKRSLSLHIENAAARCLPEDRSPEGLALIGVSSDPARPQTFVADGRAAFCQLSYSAKSILRDKSRFRVAFPKRWGNGGTPVTMPTAVVYGPSECPSFVAAFYGGLVQPQDREAREALTSFECALQRVSLPVIIEPSMIVLLDNRYTFHGRASFEPTFTVDGYPRRWLQRVFWTTTLRRFHGWKMQRGRLIEARSDQG